MLAIAQQALRTCGHQLIISDLYREGFRPLPDVAEFSHRADPEHFELMREQAHANASGKLSFDVARHQERVRWADAIIFQFPFWWWSVPAILKGWFDRILSNGFAYGSADLSGKSAMLSLTAETRAERFAAGSEYPILEHLEAGVLRYCGFTVLPRFVASEILQQSAEQRTQTLVAFDAHIRGTFPPAIGSRSPMA